MAKPVQGIVFKAYGIECKKFFKHLMAVDSHMQSEKHKIVKKTQQQSPSISQKSRVLCYNEHFI